MVEKVAIGIVEKEGLVLIVKRKQAEGKLMWQFPGGTMEEGETLEETTIREVEEETGITVKIKQKIGERIHPYTNKFMAYFACEYSHGEICVNDDDIEAAEWVSRNDFDNYFTTPVFNPIIEYLQKESA